MNEILKTIKSRRSVRAYTEQQISQEDLTAILEAATYAPVVWDSRHGISPPFRMALYWKN